MRRVFASPTSASAYSYDPYGLPLQTTTPLTDFGYAGLINEPDSGLGLATYRVYDPRVGRWISRDPIGERGDRAGNFCVYVNGDPVSDNDPAGLVSDSTPSNNQVQNAQVNAICKKLGLNKKQLRLLHDEITGKKPRISGYS
ncbi:RHS repeat-associated core domain-containing protein [Pleomorphomonas diazotrophica]|uniref:RHS repeat-associated core domain-containing protein n=1 Tax=Pleomorphomonas diazotrophica TaxID=1166257 RepID=UPI0015D653F1